jgi:hypothetical protein
LVFYPKILQKIKKVQMYSFNDVYLKLQGRFHRIRGNILNTIIYPLRWTGLQDGQD